MTILSLATLDRVPPAVARPAYDPRSVGTGIVHLGIGAFHRAHQAIYTDDALAQKGGAWGICGVSLRSPDVRDRMTPQDGLYTAVEKSPAGMQRRIIGSVREVLFLSAERKKVDARLADRAFGVDLLARARAPVGPLLRGVAVALLVAAFATRARLEVAGRRYRSSS